MGAILFVHLIVVLLFGLVLSVKISTSAASLFIFCFNVLSFILTNHVAFSLIGETLCCPYLTI